MKKLKCAQKFLIESACLIVGTQTFYWCCYVSYIDSVIHYINYSLCLIEIWKKLLFEAHMKTKKIREEKEVKMREGTEDRTEEAEVRKVSDERTI